MMIKLLRYVSRNAVNVWWRGWTIGRASDLRFAGGEFVMALGNLLTPVCFCHDSRSSIVWYQTRGWSLWLGKWPQAWWKETTAYTTAFMTNVICGLTAKEAGSAPCSTLVIKYGTTFHVSRTSLTWWRNADVNEITLHTWPCNTVTLLPKETTEFIPRDVWNTVAFKRGRPFADLWCDERVETTSTKPEGVEAAWVGYSTIAAAITQWRGRLSACFRVTSGHFKHKCWTYDFRVYFVYFVDTAVCKFDRYKRVQSVNIVYNVLLLCPRLYTLV